MSELDNLYYRRSTYRARKWQCEADRAAVRVKIERLNAAKAQITVAKIHADQARNYIRDKLGEHTESWSGKIYNDVNDIHQNGINSGFNTFYNDVDYILDAICDEITRLENENRNLGWTLNSIINTLNYIGNQIEKWRN